MLRNRELRPFAACFLLAAAATVFLGFRIDPAAGILAALSAVVYGTVFLVFTRIRYNRIARISEEIDRVLHDSEYLFISKEEEGELSVLQSEITKMTLRIREQNDALRREKQHLSDSLADIAHQLRTPLTSANLILSLLEKNPEEGERRALLRETEELFAQMEWLINSLLKLSRLDAGIVVFQREWVPVDELLHGAARPLLISMELHNIALRISVQEGMRLQGDRGWLSEAIQNILKNCIQSVGNDGSIEIVGRDTLLFGEVLIHDSGAGFDQEELPRLFDRFYRGKQDNAAGYGIGLALCKSIITRHGGTITAKNYPRGGAVFCIRFPK